MVCFLASNPNFLITEAKLDDLTGHGLYSWLSNYWGYMAKMKMVYLFVSTSNFLNTEAKLDYLTGCGLYSWHCNYCGHMATMRRVVYLFVSTETSYALWLKLIEGAATTVTTWQQTQNPLAIQRTHENIMVWIRMSCCGRFFYFSKGGKIYPLETTWILTVHWDQTHDTRQTRPSPAAFGVKIVCDIQHWW